jgi:hypothetical protein
MTACGQWLRSVQCATPACRTGTKGLDGFRSMDARMPYSGVRHDGKHAAKGRPMFETVTKKIKKAAVAVLLFRPISFTAVLALGLAAVPATGWAQAPEPLDWKGKLHFHAETTYGPWAIAGIAAYAGLLQAINSPAEWGQGGGAYGQRFGSTAAWSGIHSTLAFGLDAALHQDPRYYRSHSTGFWRRTAHAFGGTILTRTDSGGETFSTWRIGSAYGSAYLSNLWYPDRLDTVRLGFLQGSLSLGFGFAGNMGEEFWPDLKRKVLRKK